jgi:hypothetical protein
MWKLINNLLNNNKLNSIFENKNNNNFFKDLVNMENFIGYIVESSIEKNLNSINYDFDDISDTENYNMLINLELMLKKYLYENQNLLNFNTGILSKFNKNININYNEELINYNLIKCWVEEAISYFINNNNYINIELLIKILDFFKKSNVKYNNISSYDNELINNFIYTNNLEEEINKNKNKFNNTLKKIFYGLIKCKKFLKSSFYSLIIFKIIGKILSNINTELINNTQYFERTLTNDNIDKDIDKYSTYIIIEKDNLEFIDTFLAMQQIV